MKSEIKEKLLTIFTNAKDDYVSGQSISDELGCSRAAVWKHMEELRKLGYVVDAVRKKGYRIVKKTSEYNYENILFGLQTKSLGRNLLFFDEIGSTQTEAAKLALDGAPHGTVVVANNQTNGRGRLQRQWLSKEDNSVMFSMILRPNLSVQETPQLTLVAAVALAQLIERSELIKPFIKWPNDLLLHDKKFVGVLTELQADVDGVSAVIIGIGINCNQSKEDIPKVLHQVATSLKIETGQSWNRATLLQEFLLEFEELYEKYLDNGFVPIKLLWESYTNTLGKQIVANTIRESLVGKAIGIEDDGALLLEDHNGKMHRLYSADIEIQ